MHQSVSICENLRNLAKRADDSFKNPIQITVREHSPDKRPATPMLFPNGSIRLLLTSEMLLYSRKVKKEPP